MGTISIISVVIKRWKELLVIFIVFVIIGPIGFILMFGGDAQTDSLETAQLVSGSEGMAKVSPEVRKWETTVRKYTISEGIPQYTELLLALIQQESSGLLPDVMQSSESAGFPVNTLQGEDSVRQGIKHFKACLDKAQGDVKLVLQSYNFGTHFIDYVMKRGGKYNKGIAVEFSQAQARKLGWARYGDIDYVEHVLRYYNEQQPILAASTTISQFGFIEPVQGPITSGFGVRDDPFSPKIEFHKGIDYGVPTGTGVAASQSGTITKAGWQNPDNPKEGYGLRVYVQHPDGSVTIYGHLTQINVQVGQSVQQGQIIASSGNTGSSTAPHLHFEIVMNGKKEDPLNYLPKKH